MPLRLTHDTKMHALRGLSHHYKTPAQWCLPLPRLRLEQVRLHSYKTDPRDLRHLGTRFDTGIQRGFLQTRYLVSHPHAGSDGGH